VVCVLMDLAAADEIRLSSAAESKAVLDLLAKDERIARGSAFVINVDAIREWAGERWRSERADVWDYVNGRIEEHLDEGDLRHRVTETDFLIAMATEDGVAAQAVGLQILQETATFFLGESAVEKLRILALTRIEGRELICVELDPVQIRTIMEGVEAPVHEETDPEKELNPTLFMASNGDRLRIDYSTELVLSLRHGVTAALRIVPKVRVISTDQAIPAHMFSKLSDEDIDLIDRTTLAYAALFLPKDARVESPVIVPVSFRTMGARKGRNHFSTLANTTPDQIRQGMLIELIDIDRGTPNGRLVEVIGLLSRMGRGVLARLQPSRDALAPVKGARMTGLTLDFSDFNVQTPQAEALLKTMGVQMRGKAGVLIAQGLGHQDQVKMAEAAGFTHAGLRAIPEPAAI
jgi:hypothetical protein